MVHFTATLFGAAALAARLVDAAPRPRPDSAIGDEVAVSAPYGVILSDTAELASNRAEESAYKSYMPSYEATTTYMGYGSSYTSTSIMMDDKMTTSTMMEDSMSTSTMMDEYMSTSTMMDDSMSTTTMMEEATSTSMMEDSTSTSTTEEMMTTTTSSSYSYSTSVSYGSGSSSWSSGSSGYDSCVQQCVAEFGSPPPSSASSYSGSSDSSSTDTSSSSGTTHTVIVAPKQGVLRFIPFATNASIGDTINFVWHANVHTVTKSSEFSLCNKTADAPFTSGIQNESFVFTQVINDTNPLFFYCGVPTHCQKGMFGIINPPNGLTSSMSAASMQSSVVSNSSSLSSYSSYSSSVLSNNTYASNWGSAIDMSGMPSDAYEYVMGNIMYTRNFIAQNPSIVKSDGTIDMSAVSDYTYPTDVNAQLDASNSTSTSSAAGSTMTMSGAASSGARGLSSSKAFVGAVALAAIFFAL